jgi:hypothetical protein
MDDQHSLARAKLKSGGQRSADERLGVEMVAMIDKQTFNVE